MSLLDKKRILVACGTAIATATIVSLKVEELLAKHGIKADIIRCRVPEVSFYTKSLGKVDLILTTSQVPGAGDIPVLNAVALISRVHNEDVEKKILEILGKPE